MLHTSPAQLATTEPPSLTLMQVPHRAGLLCQHIPGVSDGVRLGVGVPAAGAVRLADIRLRPRQPRAVLHAHGCARSVVSGNAQKCIR